MSRIAGITSVLGDQDHSLSLMLSASMLQPSWTAHSLNSPPARIGWCGWASPNTASQGGVSAAMDGFIYEAEVPTSAASSTDAGRLIQLYLKYGIEGALNRINGDFSAALYDVSRDTLYLALDRFGVKPLYYTQRSDGIAFASQPRGILALPGFPKAVNRRFVSLFAGSHYRTFDNDLEATPYAHISRLAPAQYLEIKGTQIIRRTYWELAEKENFTASEDELAEQYHDLLLNAVKSRLHKAHRPAFTLSGGMDSSSVLASAVKITGEKQHAFSSVYEDKTYDESDEIRSMLDSTVQQWHTTAIGTPDVFALVKRMVGVHDEPVVTATWLSHFLLCESAANGGFRSFFGGLGGDELNAGEYEHFLYFFGDLRLTGDESRLTREIDGWAHYHNHPIFQKNRAVAETRLRQLMDLSQAGRCLPDQERLRRYAGAVNRDYFDLDSFSPVMDHPFKSYLKNRTYQDLHRETVPPCLRAEDRQTVAVGMDNFLPYLDLNLVEFMFRVSEKSKYRDGVTKHLLREAMRGVLPEETRTRVKKTGWNAPAHVWFSGTNREPLLDMIHSQSFRTRGIYNLEIVERITEEHEEIVTGDKAQENHMMFLWQLVNLETWLRQLEGSG